MLQQRMTSLAAEAVGCGQRGSGNRTQAPNAQTKGRKHAIQSGRTCLPPYKVRWGHSAISPILSKFENEAGPRTAFPGIFARNAVKRGNLRFLIPYQTENSRYELSLLASGLRAYIDQINIDALDVNHNRSRLVLFEPVATLTTADQFKRIFIEAMQFLLDEDRRPWPSHVSKDPAHRTWSMCFHGCELFVNVSHPAHVVRRSRNMGAGLAFVINPRRIFDIAGLANQQGSAITARIRQSIDIYDDVTTDASSPEPAGINPDLRAKLSP